MLLAVSPWVIGFAGAPAPPSAPPTPAPSLEVDDEVLSELHREALDLLETLRNQSQREEPRGGKGE